MRIVSLVPSLTATLCAVGLRDQIVGRTPFCVVPKDLHRFTENVRGPKDPDLTKIFSLQPTHILLNREENKPEHIQYCQSIAATIVTFPKSPGDVVPMLESMAAGLESSSLFDPLISELKSGLAEPPATKPRRKFVYLIWKNPYMAAGIDTYINRCMEWMGWENVVPSDLGRYPEVTIDDLHRWNPDSILLATEPYPFRKRDAAALKSDLSHSSSTTFYRIDGRLTQWYGDFTEKFLHQARKGRLLVQLF